MKKIMTKSLSLLFFYTFFAFTSIAQQSITYAYDSAGNRISRTITMVKMQNTTAEEDEIINIHTDNLSDVYIRIYPNPTKGLLKVEIEQKEDQSPITIYLYDMSGKLIIKKNAEHFITDIDISGHPNGVYILKIGDEFNTLEWKIIKQ